MKYYLPYPKTNFIVFRTSKLIPLLIFAILLPSLFFTKLLIPVKVNSQFFLFSFKLKRKAIKLNKV